MNDSVVTSKFWVVVVTALISFFAGSVIGPSIEKIIPEVLKPSLSITGLEAKKLRKGVLSKKIKSQTLSPSEEP